jgi:hypothetical protein
LPSDRANSCFNEYGYTNISRAKSIDGFRRPTNCDNNVGAVDCKHASLVEITDMVPYFKITKLYFLVILLNVGDSDYRFTFAVTCQEA